MTTYTTQQAAKRLGVTDGRIRQWIGQGRLKAAKFGSAWMIRQEDLRKPPELARGRKPAKKRPA
jgi:excisionase family DNA binding protein